MIQNSKYRIVLIVALVVLFENCKNDSKLNETTTIRNWITFDLYDYSQQTQTTDTVFSMNDTSGKCIYNDSLVLNININKNEFKAFDDTLHLNSLQKLNAIILKSNFKNIDTIWVLYHYSDMNYNRVWFADIVYYSSKWGVIIKKSGRFVSYVSRERIIESGQEQTCLFDNYIKLILFNQFKFEQTSCCFGDIDVNDLSNVKVTTKKIDLD